MKWDVETLSAFLTPVIAIATITIAFWQWQTNEQKRKNDLFDKRYAFYQRLKDYWLSTWDENLREPDVEALLPLAEEALFIFGGDISRHILSLAEKRHTGSQFFPNDDFTKPFFKYLKLR